MPSGSSDPPVAPRHTATQRRLLAALAGVGVAALTGVAFALSYDDLRALALAGRAAARYAPAYPVMYDALIVVTILSLLAARNAHWWSRWTRWLLLFALLIGAAAASIQRAVRGYDALPDQVLVAGVAAAPHVLLVIAVWLWLGMFRQARSALARRAAAPRLGPVAQVAEDLPAQTGHRGEDLVPGMRTVEESPVYGEPRSAEYVEGPAYGEEPAYAAYDEAEPSVRVLHEAHEPGQMTAPELAAFPRPRDPQAPYEQPGDPAREYPRPPLPQDEEPTAAISGAPADSHDGAESEREPDIVVVQATTLPPAGPPGPSFDLGPPRLVRAATTRPDIVMPEALDSAEDDVDAHVVERAEDPDAGDEPAGDLSRHRLEPWAGDEPGEPDGDSDADLGGDIDVERWSVTAAEDVERWADDAADDLSTHAAEQPSDVEWPPSSTFRSSPTPPTG